MFLLRKNTLFLVLFFGLHGPLAFCQSEIPDMVGWTKEAMADGTLLFKPSSPSDTTFSYNLLREATLQDGDLMSLLEETLTQYVKSSHFFDPSWEEIDRIVANQFSTIIVRCKGNNGSLYLLRAIGFKQKTDRARAAVIRMQVSDKSSNLSQAMAHFVRFSKAAEVTVSPESLRITGKNTEKDESMAEQEDKIFVPKVKGINLGSI